MTTSAISRQTAGPALADRRSELAAILERFAAADGEHRTALERLVVFRASAPTEPAHTVYEPTLCLVAQGAKQVLLGEEVYRYDAENYLLVSVGLPVAGRVIEATPERPYLCVRLDLDPAEVAAVVVEAGEPDSAGVGSGLPAPRRGLVVSRVDAPLLDAVVRLFGLLDSPRDVRVLGPLVIREILYRLLVGEQGDRLRQIALGNGAARRVAKAIDLLKRNFAEPLRIDDLAGEVHLSPSALHHHFKAVTAMSPLQYQKQLRLQEARRLMLTEAVDAATAGFRVGYESPSQFSREYRRLFGAPPLRDISRLRASATA